MSRRRRAGRAVLPVTLVAVALLGFARPAAGEAGTRRAEIPVTEEFLRGLITAAQWTFEDGEEHQRAGRGEEARVLFQRSYRLLTEADQMNADRHEIKFNRIYNLMFERLAAVDPHLRDRIEAISAQAETTYVSDPVNPGQVDYFIQMFTTTKAGFMCRSLERSLRHIPLVRAVFEEQGIPPDLAYMALVESGFRSDPTSHAGAQGMWQFMPATARDYGLRVDDEVDERNDPDLSTRAAARHLKRLHAKFRDWPLVVAAYNVGEGRVQRLLESTGSRTYRELTDKKALPEETERYVPAIVAATLISRDPVGYGLGDPAAGDCAG